MTQLGIKGGTPIRTQEFPAWPCFDEQEVKAVEKVVRSGNWGRLSGTEVAALESEFARLQNAQYAIGVTNGTTALEVALQALGIGAGDEVIVPAYTFVATATCVITANAIPVFADIDLETFNLDLDSVYSKITPRTKAIIPVHFAGLPLNMDDLLKLAKKHGLYIVEDTAHGHGASWQGKGVGSFGEFGTFSFQSSKNMNSGEGGIVITSDEKLYELATSLHSFGRLPGRPWYEHYMYSGNLRMTEMQAAILRVQLSRVDDQNKTRRKNGRYLTEALRTIPGINPVDPEGQESKGRVYHLYMFRYTPEEFNGISKDMLVEALNAEGIPVAGGYPVPLYRQHLFTHLEAKAKGCPFTCPMYDGPKVDYKSVNLPNSEQACADVLWLPQNVLLGTQQDMDDIINAVKKVRENADQLL